MGMTRTTSANGREVDQDFLAARLGRWAGGDGPLHRQLAAGISRLVTSGELHPGNRLPSERNLAVVLTVSRGTVVAAYDGLREHGVIERRRGSGTRVSGEAPMLARTAALRGEPLFEDVRVAVDLLKAIPRLQPRAREIVEGFRIPADAEMDNADPAGLPRLRERIAGLYRAEGLPTTRDDILITSGAQQGLHILTTLLCRRADVVLAEETTWPGLVDAVQQRGARVRPVPMDGQGLIVEALADAIDRFRPVLVALNPHHHNPTGSRLSPARRTALADLAGRSGAVVIEDRVAARLAFDGVVAPPLPVLAPSAPIVVVDSLSKWMWSQMRIGWVRADPVTIHRLRGLRVMQDMFPGVPSQLLALDLLEDLDTLHRESVDALRHGWLVLCRVVAEHLPDWRMREPRGGMSAWARLPSGSASEFARFATRYGVAVAGGREFSVDGSDDAHIRLPFTAPEPGLAQGIRRLGAAWDAYLADGRGLAG